MESKKRLKSAAALIVISALAASGTVSAAAARAEDGDRLSAGAEITSATPDSPGGSQLPSSYSSVDKGYVTSVKAQSYSDCWAYASLGTLESKLLREGYNVGDMSVEHLNVWAVTRTNDKGWIRSIHDDAYSSTALGCFTSWQGGVLKQDAEDIDFSSDLKGDEVPTDRARYGVTSVRYLSQNDRGEAKRAIMANGGVYTSYAHSSQCISSDRTSYYMPSNYDSSYTGHAIEVVGWDDNYPKEKFNGSVGAMPDSNGAWLIKNSWGSSYNGIGGYIWISYSDRYIFSSKYKPSYTIEKVEEITPDKKLIQNEIYGATYEFGYVEKPSVTYINKFSFDRNFYLADKIVFKTDSIGANYTIYYIPVENSVPSQDKSKRVKLSEGTVDFSGYICDDISNFDIPDAKGCIGITIDTSNPEKAATLGVGEWLVKANEEFVFINETGYGESYIEYDGETQDVMDWYKDHNDEIGGTFVIKAITVSDKNQLAGDVNLDGVVNIKDATEVQRYLAQIKKLTLRAQCAAEFDKDGSITISDATKIQKFIAKAD